MPWSLSTGEDVDNAHTPVPARLPRKQSGNGQNVSKAASAKGGLAKGRIKPEMFTNTLDIPGSALGQEKKEELA